MINQITKIDSINEDTHIKDLKIIASFFKKRGFRSNKYCK